MAYTPQIDIAPEEVRRFALPILERRLGVFNFKDAAVTEEIDFDGEPILQMVAEVEDEVPAKELTSATTDIRSSAARPRRRAAPRHEHSL